VGGGAVLEAGSGAARRQAEARPRIWQVAVVLETGGQGRSRETENQIDLNGEETATKLIWSRLWRTAMAERGPAAEEKKKLNKSCMWKIERVARAETLT
jgi:hypothetical protein